MKKIILFFLALFLYANDIQYYLLAVKVNYKEYDDSGKFLDGESSSYSDMKGIGIRYEAKERFYYFLKGEYVYGSTVYDGATWDGTPLSEKTNNVYIYNLQAGLYPFKNPYYISLGYRFWNRGKSDDPGDYDEEYYWKYISSGLNYKFNVSGIVFTADVEYQYALNPQLKAYLGNGVKLNLGVTDGIKALIKTDYKIKQNISISFMFKYQIWHINRSASSTVILDNQEVPVHEPESYTLNRYLGLGIVYKY